MKIVIIEGTDNVGKDTVINSLTYEFSNSIIYHCEKPKSITSEEQAEEQEAEFAKLLGYTLYEYSKNETNDDVVYIHNRSWYGEYVYGCMYRGNDDDKVKDMIWDLENSLVDFINPKDLYYITLLSSDMDFLVKNDDGLSISEAKADLIKEETRRFKAIHDWSRIKNKHIIYVNDGDKFRPKEDILNEVLGYVYNKNKQLSIDDFPGLKAVKDSLLEKGWKKIEK